MCPLASAARLARALDKYQIPQIGKIWSNFQLWSLLPSPASHVVHDDACQPNLAECSRMLPTGQRWPEATTFTANEPYQRFYQRLALPRSPNLRMLYSGTK